MCKHYVKLACLAMLAGAFGPAQADTAADTGPLLARTVASTTLPGSGHSWGFITLDAPQDRLLLARRENGLTVVDTARRQAPRTLPDSAGANAVVLVPGADRAYVANMDGTLTVLRLSDLRQLQRIPVSDANLNSAVFDAASNRVIIASGRRAERSTLYLIDPTSDRIVAHQDVDVRKIDPLLVVGDGTLLLPMRDEGAVMRVDAATLAVRDTWRFAGCEQPSALAADIAQRRLFVACRGAAPILVVADLDNGTRIAALPTGHAVNALAYDARLRRILVPSGIDAQLRIVAQDDADHYRVLGDVATRTWAHNMAYDAASQRAYLATMDVTQPAPGPGGKKADPLFHPDSFTVLTLQLEK